MESTINPIDFFRAKSQEATSEISRINLLRAVEALSKFTGGAEINFDSFDDSMLGEWVSVLLFNGYTPKTISNNILKRIATLYNKAVEASLAKPTDVFRKLQNALNEDTAAASAPADSKTFGKLQDLIRTDGHGNSTTRLAKDLVLFAVYMGGMSFDELADFRKDDYRGDDEHILEIVARYSKSRNSYLFPLDQVHSTPAKRRRSIESLYYQALKGTGLKLSATPAHTSYHLWALAAMCIGISASDIAACLPQEVRKSTVTAYAVTSEIGADRIREIRSRVVSTLNHNPMHWYAMHLRRHVDFDTLAARFKERNIAPEQVYYPMEEIIHKVGRKKVFESKPVVGWLLFFRERVTKLGNLFNEIGDLAWGYRYSNDVRSHYAVIREEEIRGYQSALGTLTPDTEILPDDAVTFNKGDYLIILGGVMNGRHGVFVSEKQAGKGTDEKKIVFRVRLGGGTNANWTVDWDPRLVRKITETEYSALESEALA